MMPVASTDSVSMYTQKVSANHRKLVVTFAAAVLTRTCRNVRSPPGGASRERAAPSAAPLSAAPPSTAGAVSDSMSGRRSSDIPRGSRGARHRREVSRLELGWILVSTLHDTAVRGFASDNYSGVHPEVLAAIG